MSENQIKDAFNRIEPEEGAQQRMYQNILRKAAALQQEAVPDQQHEIAPTSEKNHERTKILRPVWQKYIGFAACFALVLVGAFALHLGMDRPNEGGETPVLVGSPIQDVSGPEGFAALDIMIDAPENATEVGYYILDGEIARVDFTLDGHSYTYSASRVDGDFSGIHGTVENSISVDAKYSAILEQYDSGTWNACWKDGDLTYYLSNDDGATKEGMADLIQNLISKLP